MSSTTTSTGGRGSKQRGRGQGGRGRGGGAGDATKKESILELAKLMDHTARVKCLGGRELRGTLRGYDELVNLVLDDCEEFIRGTCVCVSLAVTPSWMGLKRVLFCLPAYTF
jgi:U6 snRNA-associated Sm-like protein LSm7